MHIEIDVLEMIVLIFSYTFCKWLFRGLIIAFVIRMIDQVKKKGMEKIENIKNDFAGDKKE